MSSAEVAMTIDEGSILESFADGVVVLDREWRLTYLNPQQAKWFNVAREEVLGRTIWEVCPEWTVPEIQQQLQQALAHQTPIQLEHSCARQQGWFELRLSPSLTGMVILTIDITARKQAAVALRDSESRFQAFMNHSPVSAWIVDEAGHMLYLNPTYAKTFFCDEDTVGKHIADIFSPEVAEHFIENNRRVFATGQMLQTIEYAPGPDRNIRSFLVCKFPITHASGEKLLGGVAVDISEQKRTEAALRESDQHLKVALRTAKLGAWQHDLTTNVLTCSDQCKANFGLPADAEFTHETLFSMLHPEDCDLVQAAIQRAIEDRTDYEVEERCFHPDGSLHWLIARGGLVFDDDGNPVRLVGVTLDITERKQFEESLKAANQRVSNILESITDAFVAFDQEWHYTYVNQEAARLLGRTPEELLGKRWQEVFPELAQQDTAFLRQIQRVMSERVTVHFEGFSVAVNRWIETAIFPASQGIAVFFRDISDRKQEEQRKALQYSVSQILAEATTLVDIVPTLLQSLCETLGWQVGTIWNLDRTGTSLCCTSNWAESAVKTSAFVEVNQRTAFALGTGLPGRIWHNRQPAWISDISQDQHFLRQAAASEAGLCAGFGFPILLGDEFFGVIECFSDRIQAPDEDLLQLMAAIGRQIGQFMERKRTEAALRESEDLFQSFMSHSPIAAYIKDESGQYVYVNALIERLFDCPACELVGSTDFDWFPPEAIDQIRANDAAVLARNEALQFLETVPFEQQVRHFMAFKFPLQNASGRKLLGGVSIDISDRIQAETSLRQREEELRAITNTVPALISFVDTEQRYRFNSQRYQDWFGRSPEAIQGKYLWEVVGDTVYERVRPYVEQALSGEAVTFEHQMAFQDGVTRYVSVSYIPQREEQQVTGLVALINDISDRKQHEKALQASAERLSLTLAAARMGDWSWDAATDRVTLSPQAYEIFGIPSSEGLTWTALRQHLHPEDQEKARVAVEQSTREHVDYDIEYRVITEAGAERWIAAKGRAQYDAAGDVLGMLGVVQNITERKQAEAEREELLQREKAAREQAESANRIKDEFLAVLSHELRSPLNPILGWVKLLQKGSLDSKATYRALETIERNAKLQTQLIDDLLDVSRILRGKIGLNRCLVNLVTVVESAMETVRLAAEAKQIQIQTTITLTHEQVFGDSTRLQQIVWNLLSNAVKFTPPGGHIDVSLSQVDNYTQVQVKDTGKGISPVFLPYVFDYFRQEDGKTTRQFGGLGLGLAIVRYLTELHGGTVQADSAGEGQGATFTVQLPLIPHISASGENVSFLAPSVDLRHLRVLVVDDDEDMRDLAQTILEQQGAEVTVVTSAAEVLKLFDHQPPDVFISDIGMPEVDGYMLMQQIRRRLPEHGGLVPAIALTAYAGEHNQQKALKVGFQRHVAKPVEPEELIRTIADLVGG